MKGRSFWCAAVCALFVGCGGTIKNDDVVLDEIGSSGDLQVSLSDTPTEMTSATANLEITDQRDLLGFWVGYFRRADESEYSEVINPDEGIYWSRENKINISIDEISDGKVKGHSVVAGNDRPFEGTCTEQDDLYVFEVSEPGDDKYDGKFNFEISKLWSTLKGTWKAYKKIDIQERVYELEKKIFTYNPEQMLEYSRRYSDWDNSKKTKSESEDDLEFYGDFYTEFSTATDSIYTMNASSTLLTKADVENLRKGDLLIIRNTIYARHGYSFKMRPLRVFFDSQDWYIPVHTDIKSSLTETEKKNIELLLKYEKNATEYYDTFGRG